MRLAYHRTGGALPRVILLHGLLGAGACWTPIARALARDFDVVMPDLRGHGHSPDGAASYTAHAGDVVETLGDLADAVLVGHSMGGLVAAIVASQVRVRGVVLVDPTFLEPARQREVFESDVAAQHRHALALPAAELVAQLRARHPHRSLELAQLQVAARLQTRIAALDILAPPLPDYREVVRAIAAPRLLVIGDREPVVTRAMALELQVRVVEIADAGHGLPFDQPERLAEVVAAFTARPAG